ncbi:DUF4870 family protein [Faucicola boevrei]|uniref:DUF4870 family protein n=1 Tax=Faucicola boevrei TaxID=346665 RepID=UPI00037083B0|nr:hypothetical protein [Moraxella boevrei]
MSLVPPDLPKQSDIPTIKPFADLTDDLTDNHQLPLVFLPENSATIQRDVVSRDLIIYNHATYALAVFSYLTAGLTWIIPIVMNYAKRDEARNTWLYSHFDWQIKTFWYSVFFGGIGVVLMLFGFGTAFISMLMNNDTLFGSSGLAGLVGVLIFVVVLIWHFYRMVRGWVALIHGRAVP